VTGNGRELGGSVALGPWHVRRAGYGAMQLAGDGVFGPPRDRDEALQVLRAAVAAGVDHIDTGQCYGAGTVNELIQDALFPYPDGLAIGRFRQMAAWQRARRMERVPVSWSGSRPAMTSAG
jgi:aryl-alcohol dehydrogenase-like predicted oxidoreductase